MDQEEGFSKPLPAGGFAPWQLQGAREVPVGAKIKYRETPEGRIQFIVCPQILVETEGKEKQKEKEWNKQWYRVPLTGFRHHSGGARQVRPHPSYVDNVLQFGVPVPAPSEDDSVWKTYDPEKPVFDLINQNDR
jgi:hypothetical protein